MKTLTNKLVMSVLALVLTGMALSVGVFAWFTINNTAAVDQFSANVQAGDGFYISANGTNWKSTLSNADLGTALSNIEFVPLTSETGSSLVDFDGDAAQSGGFIQFNLWFAGSSTLNSIQLTNIILSSTPTEWIPGVYVAGTRQSLDDSTTPITDYASNAARVSFQDMFNQTAVKVVEQKVNALGDSLTIGTSEHERNSLGKGTAVETPLSFTNEAIKFYNAIMSTPIDYAKFNGAILAPTIEAGNAVNQIVATLEAYDENEVDYPVAFVVPQAVQNTIGENYKVGAVTVRVWIEGWDQEAFNAILKGELSVSFSFTGIA
ncbi:hypothetical protein [Acholeplasma granularum]|uniref:hypothetical protein n=1 Tax=Acholeplasma granularum TaxID=264635 RepID=UPI00046F6E37|nr:hypothetical protein [Acholeplasma granularum]